MSITEKNETWYSLCGLEPSCLQSFQIKVEKNSIHWSNWKNVSPRLNNISMILIVMWKKLHPFEIEWRLTLSACCIRNIMYIVIADTKIKNVLVSLAGQDGYIQEKYGNQLAIISHSILTSHNDQWFLTNMLKAQRSSIAELKPISYE